MPKFWKAYSDWSRYERLNHYPELKGFNREGALRRLQLYEREERKACEPWLTLITISNFLWMLAFLILFRIPGFRILRDLIILIYVPSWVTQYVLYRRIRKRVAAKVAAELSGGRMKTCFECGYDLRATSGDVCTECGRSIVSSFSPKDLLPQNRDSPKS